MDREIDFGALLRAIRRVRSLTQEQLAHELDVTFGTYRELVELLAMHRFVRKLGHFTEYLILSVLLYRALRAGRRWNLRAAATAIVVAGLYAVADEFHQLFVPGRTAAASDCLIDVSGAAAGQGLLAVFGRLLRG